MRIFVAAAIVFFAVIAMATTVTLTRSGGGSATLSPPVTFTNASDIVALTLRANTGGQTNKVFKLFRSNGDECFSLDNNGAILTCGDITVNNYRTNNNSLMESASGVGNPAWKLHGTDGSTVFDSFLEIDINKAGNRGLVVMATTSQTANMVEYRDITPTVLSGVNANGNQFLHCYAGTSLPTATVEGEIICNNTDHVVCEWNGSAWKRFDGSTACH